MGFIPKSNNCGLFENTRSDKSDLTGQIQIECPRCHASSGWWVNSNDLSAIAGRYRAAGNSARSERAKQAA